MRFHLALSAILIAQAAFMPSAFSFAKPQDCLQQAKKRSADIRRQAVRIRLDLQRDAASVQGTGNPEVDVTMGVFYLLALNKGIGRSKKVEFTVDRIENSKPLYKRHSKVVNALCQNGWNVWDYVVN